MFTLKSYQQETLRVIREYLEAARFEGLQLPFEKITRDSGSNSGRPYQAIEGLKDVPYVCLRLPTGGGKTLLAAHSVGIAAAAYLEEDYPLVLWLVPTNTIRTQTLETLKTPGHPNREALENAFEGRLLILDIADFTQIRPHDLQEKTCVVVGTMATLRVEKPEGRKVYAHNEYLEPHFSRVPPNTPGLERIEEGPDKGKIKFSFRNLLAIHRPLTIVDEAHNASTALSFEVMQRINPACIIEFTATPASNSNILHNVSAAELKAEAMIKLPIILTEHPNWQSAIRDSIFTRQKLQALAEEDRDFIRPIVLIQAENKDREVTVDVVERYLMEEEKISRERIAIATGTQRELDGINLLDPNTKVEFVITVQALKEGWDCPFAYVFCSVANVHSKKDVEQLLGRVLRMPYAKRRENEKLNQAYANVSSTSWPQAVSQLHDRLVSMGFDQQEADQFIKPQQTELPLGDTPKPGQPFVMELSDLPDLSGFDLAEQAQLNVEEVEGIVKLTVHGSISSSFEAKLKKAIPPEDREAFKKTLAVHRFHHQRPLSPSERGESFTVPQLCFWLEGELELAEKEIFLDVNGWNLLDYPAKLTEQEFTIQEKASSFLIDVRGRRLYEKYLGFQTALDFKGVQTEWNELSLSRWLDRRLYQPDIKQEILLEFLRRTVSYLIDKRDIAMATLIRARYSLEKILREKINEYRLQAYRKGYQETLFGPRARVETSYEFSFNYDPHNYPASHFYSGSYQFNKHFYPKVGELKPSGEEFDCAQAIDQCYQIKYWVRNIERQPNFSFWLPTATDKFYPDFVALLNDGRIFVIEYKGAHLADTADTKEKQNLGELWEEKSHGKGLFLMAVKKDEKGRSIDRQIEDKIAGR